MRHMHREHSASSNPTCVLRAPFVSHTFHFCLDLCRAREVNAQTPNKRDSDNRSVLTKLTTNAMHACDMTLTYLTSSLSTCSAVWVSVQCFFLTFIKFLMQLCKNFFYRL